MNRSILIIIALTTLLTLIIGLDLTPWLRGGYGWRWAYAPADVGRSVPLLVAVAGYVLGGWVIVRQKRAPLTLLWAMAGTVIISVAVTYAHHGDPLYTLFARTVDVTTTGQHQSALELDWESEQWRDWSDYMRGIDGHIALSPPGGTLWYGALNAGLEQSPALADTLRDPLLDYQCHNYAFINTTPAEQASTWFGVLMPLWAALTVLPLYAAGRLLVDADTARWMVVWWALVPGIAAFAASWNTLYPLLAVTALWLLLRGLRGHPGWLVSAGTVTGVALFTNFAFVPLPAVLGFYTLGYYAFHERHTRPLARPFVVGAWFALGLMLPWLLFFIPTGQTPVDMLAAALDYHFDLERPYWFWLGMHLWDWLLWAGLAFSLLGLTAIFHWARHPAEKPPLLAMATFLTITIIALSDTARGETGRVWLFLAPFLLIAAGDGLRRLTASIPSALHTVTGLQAAATVILVATVPVMGLPLTPTPDPLPPVAAQPAAAAFALSDVGTVFDLRGWQATVTDDKHIQLDLTWQGARPTTTPLWFGAFLVGPDGTTTDPILWQPGQINGDAARYPTTCWQNGQPIGDQIVLPLPEDIAAGEWWVSLAAFGDAATPEGRLRVTGPDGSDDVQVGLGPIRVE